MKIKDSCGFEHDYDKICIITENVNCKNCLPCGICERFSTFDETIYCVKSIGIVIDNPKRKNCMNCLNSGRAMKDFPCKECVDCSNWREKYND